MCEVTSWIPHAVVETLRDRTAQPVIAWLTTIRASIEEYDPLIVVRPPSTTSEDTESDCAFDEILSQLGKEIFKLDEYQRNLAPDGKEVSISILNIFDECLQGMNQSNHVEIETKVITTKTKQVPNENSATECSDCESKLSEVSFMTSTPVKGASGTESKRKSPPPVPPRKVKMRTPSPSYDNVEFINDTNSSNDSKNRVCDNDSRHRVSDNDSRHRVSDNDSRNSESEDDSKNRDSGSDSESTCWSYKECNVDNDNDNHVASNYAAVWSHSSGYHNSDEILRHVLSQAEQRATISRMSFDTASDLSPQTFSVYTLQEVGDRCELVDAMTPDKPCDDGYEPVRDAITDENIYEEIEFGCSYTDEGCSCGGSVEVESCSISASSEGVGRESPLYANLRDHDAYKIPPDVIFWKNMLLDPFYNDDEEDVWITPEECEAYSRDRRPPLVIPRITQYRAPRREPRPHIPYPEVGIYSKETIPHVPAKSWNWSPTSERNRLDLERSFSKSNCDSPPLWSSKRLGGSTENLLAVPRRPNHLHLENASSGDSLDVEVRERERGYPKERSRSMVAPKQKPRAPLNSPRLVYPSAEVTVIYEGQVKRTKFYEGGKKSKKNWTECYLILTKSEIIFYKDKRSYLAEKTAKSLKTPPSPTAPRGEMYLPLLNANVVPCLQTQTRRFSRSLVLEFGPDKYLIQEETEEAAKLLLKYIQTVIYKLRPSALDERPSPYQSSNTDLESLGRTPPASRHATRTKQRAGGSSNEDLSNQNEASIQKSHVRSRLRKFFAKRPPIDILIDKGIYEDETVFGQRLENVCPAQSPRVPVFVRACIEEIECDIENMCTDGLYRASGNLSQVQKIRLEIDQHNLSIISKNTDIHVLTGSLKLFFRELKEPLIPFSMFNRVLAACSIRPKESKVKEFRDIVSSLPQCNRDTLKFLLEHLLKVTKYSERNRMHTANLAIVFGPTLLWAPDEERRDPAIDCIQQNNVVETLLNEFNDIFLDTIDNKGKKKS